MNTKPSRKRSVCHRLEGMVGRTAAEAAGAASTTDEAL